MHEKLSWEKASKKFTFLTSHGEKDFGAYDFYTPGMNYPSRESTRTDLVSTGYEGDFKKLQLVFHINYRSHFDRFILDKNRPGLYTNETRNRNLSSDFLLRVGDIAFGGEIAREYFTSLKSGTYSHFRSAIFGEYKKNIKKRILANFGLRLDYHSLYSSFFSPDICLTFLISNDFKIRTSMGKSFRAPSYTELYYKDPVNIGNPELKPERSSSYEFGFDYSIQKIFEAKLSLFQRDEKDLIDWIKREKKWYAENIRSRRVKGIEIDLRKKFRYAGFALKSSFFKMKENQSELIYKYSFRIPENQTTFSAEINPLHSLFLGLNFLYKKRANEKSYTPIDAKFSKRIGSFEIFLEGKNLLNVRYEEIKGVPMPGRWIGGGISVKTEN
ncbi:MAG: TonB-dependent receptor plug domain-containing protein [Candidatus Aminicenantia bacterium]